MEPARTSSGLSAGLRRALSRRCPRCGGPRIFASYFRLKGSCPTCAHMFERESGYWVGAMIVNTAVTETIFGILFVTVLFLQIPDVRWVPAAGDRARDKRPHTRPFLSVLEDGMDGDRSPFPQTGNHLRRPRRPIRMTSLRLTLAVLVAAAAVVVMPATAHACSCVQPPPPSRAVRNYDVVFAGTVVRAEAASPAPGPTRTDRVAVSSFEPVRYTFEVDAVVKGEAGMSTEILSPGHPVSCGASFREGRRYLVFAYFGDGFKSTDDQSDPLWTNLCTPNQRLSPGEALPVPARNVEREIVGPPLEPPVDEDVPAATVVLALTGLALVTYVLIRWRASPRR